MYFWSTFQYDSSPHSVAFPYYSMLNWAPIDLTVNFTKIQFSLIYTHNSKIKATDVILIILYVKSDVQTYKRKTKHIMIKSKMATIIQKLTHFFIVSYCPWLVIVIKQTWFKSSRFKWLNSHTHSSGNSEHRQFKWWWWIFIRWSGDGEQTFIEMVMGNRHSFFEVVMVSFHLMKWWWWTDIHMQLYK